MCMRGNLILINMGPFTELFRRTLYFAQSFTDEFISINLRRIYLSEMKIIKRKCMLIVRKQPQMTSVLQFALFAGLLSKSVMTNPASCTVTERCYPEDCSAGFIYVSSCDCKETCLPFNGTCTCPPVCPTNPTCDYPVACEDGITFKNACDCYTRCVLVEDTEGARNCAGVNCTTPSCPPEERYIHYNECCPRCKKGTL